MRTVVRHLVPSIMVALASIAAVTITMPEVSSADVRTTSGGTRRAKCAGRWASGHNPWHASRASGGAKRPW
jgi:hypothetical protein